MNELEKLQENLEKLKNTKQVELLSPNFLKSCSKFNNIEEMFLASGFSVEIKEDFETIPDLEWEEFIISNTSFSSWEKMQKSAGELYIKKQLNL
jgi:hypothetical protein